MGDYKLSTEEANLAKRLLINIGQAVCCRLDVIDDQLEGICQSTKYLEDQMNELLAAENICWKETSDTYVAGKRRKKDLEYTSTRAVNVIHLNREEDFPDGSWLGDENDPFKRVRVSISPRQLELINLSCSSAVKMALRLLDCLFDRGMQAVSNVNGTGKLGKHQLDPVLMYGIQCHLEHRFGTMPEEWKEIQLHVDSKCRSAYRSKSRGLLQTIHAFRSRTMEQDVGYVRGLGTVSAETCSSNSDPHLQENPLTVKDENASEWAMEVGTCRVYAADESIAPLRLVCIPVSECDVDNSPLNCSGLAAITSAGQMPS